MKISADEIRAQYRNMSDGELLALNRDELTEVARACYDQEIERRGVEPDDSAPEEAAPGGVADEPWAAVGLFTSADEAWRAQSMLEAADIPARILNNEERGHSTQGFQVQVPASLLEDAQRVAGAQEPDAIIVTARYEDGVFKPLEDVDIQEGAVVEVHVPAKLLNP